VTLSPPAPTAAPRTAATISVAQTLALLDGEFLELAEGMSRGLYALWLGSGISRDAVDDLEVLVRKVLRYLRDNADFTKAGCPFADAIAHGLEDVFWVEGEDGKWKPRVAPTRAVDELVRERTSIAVKAALTSLLEAPVANANGGRRRALRAVNDAAAGGAR
jgi:hypothetical protein